MTEKPKPYRVWYSDPELYARALKRAGGEPDLLEDPSHYWDVESFDTLEEARGFRDGSEWPEGAYIVKVVRARYEYPYWDWDEEEVD